VIVIDCLNGDFFYCIIYFAEYFDMTQQLWIMFIDALVHAVFHNILQQTPPKN